MGAGRKAALNDPFLIDECLSPDLAAYAHSRGHAATHVNHRDLRGWPDHRVMRAVREEGFVLVTANARDFLRLFAAENPHSGLVILVPGQLPAAHRYRSSGRFSTPSGPFRT